MQPTTFRLMSGLGAFALGIFVAAWLPYRDPALVPASAMTEDAAVGWRRVRVGGFSISVPPSMQGREARGIDISVWEFQDRSTRLAIMYGHTADGLTSYAAQPSYREESAVVGGRVAKLVTFRLDDTLAAHFGDAGRYIAAAHFPEVSPTAPTRLSLWANCMGEQEQETAKRIFLTVRFE